MANEIHRLLQVGFIGGRKIRTNDLAVLVRGNFEATECGIIFASAIARRRFHRSQFV